MASLLRPGYNQVSTEISDLGVGSGAIIQNANFIISGALSIFFALGLGKAVSIASGRTARGLERVVLVFGLAIILAGVFLIFVGAIPTSDAVPLYYAHTAASFIGFLAIIVAQFLTWRELDVSNPREWISYRRFSLLSGILSVFLLLVFLFTMTSFYQGATEKLFVAVPLIWIEVSAIKLHSFHRRPQESLPHYPIWDMNQRLFGP
jgi:Protein of unknown function (DUF998)